MLLSMEADSDPDDAIEDMISGPIGKFITLATADTGMAPT